jgi:hypothetical protein
MSDSDILVKLFKNGVFQDQAVFTDYEVAIDHAEALLEEPGVSIEFHYADGSMEDI